MNNKELIQAVSEITGSSFAETKRQVSALVSVIVTESKSGKVRVAGLGIFETVLRKARTGVNPSTGQTLQIAAKTAPKFKAAKAFKEAVA